MRQIGVIAATLIAATTVTNLNVTAAVLIVVSSLLHHAGPNLAYLRQLQVVAKPANFGVPTAAPVNSLANSRELDAEMLRVSFSMLADSSAGFFGASHAPYAPTQAVSFERPAATLFTSESFSARRHANARPVAYGLPSPIPATFYGPPQPLETNADRIKFDIPSLAPMAFVRFCMRTPQDCNIQGKTSQPELVLLTTKRRAELEKVNRKINRAISPKANKGGVMTEEWLVAPREGDCNDYAVTKRHNLLSLGWPSRSLLLAEVIIPSGQHHLVLVVRTHEGDFVLDNLNENVHTVSQISYQWVRAQQPKNPRFWSSIEVTRATRNALNAR